MEMDYKSFQLLILQFEEEGLVTRTFRRLDAPRQQAVISSIMEDAAEFGPAHVNIKRVAERAGVAVGSLYQYFGGRNRMVDFAVEISCRTMVAMFHESIGYFHEMNLRDGLRMYLSYGIEWTREQSAFLRLFARAAYHGDPSLQEKLVKPVAEAMRNVVIEILRQAQARVELRANLDLEASARVINALSIALGDSQLMPYLNQYFLVTDQQVGFERILDAYCSLLVDGIGIRKEEA